MAGSLRKEPAIGLVVLNTAGILFTGKAGKWPGARSVAAYVTKPGHAA